MEHLHTASARPALGILLLSFAASTTMVQVDPVLRAPTANNTLYLEMRPDNDQYSSTNGKNVLFFYSNSYRFPTPFNVDEMELFSDTLLLMERGKFNLNYRLTNPLKYTVSVNSKEVEDDGDAKETAGLLEIISFAMQRATGLNGIPAAAAANASSVKAMGELAARIGSTKAPPPTLTAAPAGPAPAGAVPPAQQPPNVFTNTVFPKMKTIADPEVRQMLLLLAPDPPTRASNTDLLSLADAVTAVEVEVATGPIAETGNAIHKAMLAVNITSTSAEQAISDLNGSITALKAKNDQLKVTIDALNNVNTTGFALTESAKTLLVDVVQVFQTDALQKHKARTELHDRLIELHSILKSAVSKAADSPSRSVHLVGGDIPLFKQRKIGLKVTEKRYSFNKETFAITSTDTTVIERNFKLRSTQWLYPRAYAALVYIPNLSYPEFYGEADSTGSLFVRRKQTAANTLSVSAMVNFNIKMGRSPVVPFFQAGAWYKRQQPMLFFGAGIRLTTWLAASGGVMQTWTTGLNELKVGQEVESQDVIDKDLSFSPEPLRGYFSIQFTAPEKKNP